MINVPYRIFDRYYPKEDGSGTRVLEILPGRQRLDGSTALAFAGRATRIRTTGG